MSEQREKVTIGPVADALGVSKDTVRSLVERGELPATKYGKWLRFYVDDVNEYINKNHINYED